MARREEIRLHHTSAHLLQAALIKVLGDEVHQAGSQVEENRMRFDFSFNRAMTPEEIFKVEEIMNNWIAKGYEVKTDVMDIEQANLPARPRFSAKNTTMLSELFQLLTAKPVFLKNFAPAHTRATSATYAL